MMIKTWVLWHGDGDGDGDDDDDDDDVGPSFLALARAMLSRAWTVTQSLGAAMCSIALYQ